jgi:hypothetical protein
MVHPADDTHAATPTVARYGIRYEGYDVEVVVGGEGELAADRVRVLLDGVPVDRSGLSTRAHDVALRTPDGVELRLHVGGREPGVLARVRLRRPDGYWVDLRERPAHERPGRVGPG